MSLIICFQARRDLVPQFFRYDGFVLAGIRLPAMNDLAEVDAIVQEMIEGSPRIRCTPGCLSSLAGANLASNLPILEMLFEFHDAAKAKILPKKFANGGRFVRIDDELMLHAF